MGSTPNIGADLLRSCIAAKSLPMHRRSFPFHRLSALLLMAPLLLGQLRGEPAADPDVEEAAARQQISSRIAAAVRATLPTYVAPIPKAPASVVPESGPETNEAAVVLDKFTIFGAKTLDFSERELLSPKGLAAYLRKRYPGAGAAAGLMLEEDIRLENMARLERVVENLQKIGDWAGSKDLQKEINRTFMRRTDWRSEGLDRLYNRGRR